MPRRHHTYHLLSTGEQDFLVAMNVESLNYILMQVRRCRIVRIAETLERPDLRRLPAGPDHFRFAVNKRNKTLSMLTSKYIGRQPQVWIVDMKVKL